MFLKIYDYIGRKVLELDNSKLKYQNQKLDIKHLSPANYQIIINYKTGEKWNAIINKR